MVNKYPTRKGTLSSVLFLTLWKQRSGYPVSAKDYLHVVLIN